MTGRAEIPEGVSGAGWDGRAAGEPAQERSRLGGGLESSICYGPTDWVVRRGSAAREGEMD